MKGKANRAARILYRKLRARSRVLWRLANRIYFRIHHQRHAKAIDRRNVFTSHLPGENVLVLAPHVDDEVFGCGGAILDYVRRGKRVSVVYLTDGGKRGKGESRAAIAEERRQEAFRVADECALPREDLHFLSGRDGELITSPIEEELRKVFETVQPDVLFLPLAFDTHVDHHATGTILHDLLQSTPRACSAGRIYLYEVQSPMTLFYSNVCLDISDLIDKKMALTRHYVSQGGEFAFSREQARANAMAAGRTGSLEVFIEMSPAEFRAHYRKLVPDERSYRHLQGKLVRHSNSENTIRSYRSSRALKSVLAELHLKRS